MSTRNPWVVWCFFIAGLGSPCTAQHSETFGVTGMEQEIWKFLAEAIESTRCSEQGARAIQTHLESHGLPWSVEAAWSIEGLSGGTALVDRFGNVAGLGSKKGHLQPWCFASLERQCHPRGQLCRAQPDFHP